MESKRTSTEQVKKKLHGYPGAVVHNDTLFSQRYYTFKLLHTQKSNKIVAGSLIGMLAVGLVFMFLPWQQNISANGFVTALNPSERPQIVTNPIGGMIEEWLITEGQYVKAGDTLVKISEIKDKYFDPNLLDRMAEQVKAKESAIQNMNKKLLAMDEYIQSLKEGMELSITKARNKIIQANHKRSADSADLSAAKTDYEVANDRYLRNNELYKKELISRNSLESYKLKIQEASAKLNSARNKFSISTNELKNVEVELNSVKTEYQGKIAKAISEKNEASYGLNNVEAELSKLKTEQKSTEIRNSNYYVHAHQSGYVVKAYKSGVGEIIKEGEAILSILPDKHTLATELYINATDVPLLTKGRKVRLQFDGWPALQFSGWPSVAVGTFGGIIANIDRVNSSKGKYRILITQDSDEEPWPAQLRMGSGVYGWAMLDNVPVWFEVWRQLNGFPPSLQSPPDEEKENKKEKESSNSADA